MNTLEPRLRALAEDLRSPDPDVRDAGAYTALVELAEQGLLDNHLVPLGDLAVDLLGDAEVQARTFAALLIAIVTDRDNRTARASDEAVGRWLRAVAGWYVDEPDTRGWDDHLGWLHAVAHGADAIGELAVSPRLGRDELATLLDLLVARTVAPTGTHWVQNEDDRVAVAVMAVLRRDLLLVPDVRAALDALAGAWREADPGPVAANVDNAVRLARTLHLQLTLGARPAPEAPVVHPAVRAPALHTLGCALAEIHWFYGSPA